MLNSSFIQNSLNLKKRGRGTSQNFSNIDKTEKNMLYKNQQPNKSLFLKNVMGNVFKHI